MRLQVLVSTMHQSDFRLLEKMNICSDAVVVNQCEQNCVREFEFRGNHVLWIDTNERGVGRSRNRAILASSADILLFADDDVVYEDRYLETVLTLFETNPGISLATFNLNSLNPDRPEPLVKKDYRLRWYNCLKFGAFRIAVRRNAILNRTIYFSLLFGGGAKYKSGEDNLFITQCLQSGLRGVASSARIGTVAQQESTWFTGYDERYYMDRGSLFAAMYGKWAKLVLFFFEIRSLDSQLKFRLETGCRGIKRFVNE